MIHFLHPATNTPSGGNVYNRHIIQQALAANFPLRPIVVAAEQINADFIARLTLAPGDSLLWDSLFAQQLTETAARMPHRQHVLLLHYLASENPLLDAMARYRLQTLEQRLADTVSAFITTGQRLAGRLKQRFPDQAVFVVEPGVAAPFFSVAETAPLCADQHAVQLLTVANLLPAKGHLEILAVLAQLLHLNWRWHLVGDDQADTAYAERVRRAIETSGFRERIVYHGILSQPDLARLLRMAQLFVFASHYEAYGMALAEAVAAGLPIISTRVGDAEYLIQQGSNGFWVEVGDWQHFQRCLERLMRNPQRYRSSPASIRTWQMAGDDFIKACFTLQSRT